MVLLDAYRSIKFVTDHTLETAQGFCKHNTSGSKMGDPRARVTVTPKKGCRNDVA